MERRPREEGDHDLVQATTDQASPKFVPPEARIAAFDQDGTTWVSHPMYTQVVYCLERVPAVVKAKPELKNVEPFKTVLSCDREAMAKFTMKDLEKILAATRGPVFRRLRENVPIVQQELQAVGYRLLHEVPQ